jgi:inner membrane protein
MAIRFNTNSISVKAAVIGLIVLILMIPLSMLRGLINERSQMREQASRTVADGWGGQLVVGGPAIELPFEYLEADTKGGQVLVKRQLTILPSQLDYDITLKNEVPRHVGIYKVPVYIAKTKIKGRYSADAIATALAKENVDIKSVRFAQARMRLPLSEVRSVHDLAKATLNDKPITLLPAQPGFYLGSQAEIDLTEAHDRVLEFAFEMDLAGSTGLAVLPLGAVTTVNMASAWPHPKFSGHFLPAERHIDAKGFTARWQVLELNRQFSSVWLDREFDPKAISDSVFGVELFQSVDVYQRSERSVKYALVFVALTFLTFFAWEQIGNRLIHPMQYLLVGLALSTFYLLLIALSEHMSFWLAYAAAASALVVLIGVYMSGALSNKTYGLAVGGAMSLIYSVLYLLVISEQYSLLMGAIVLFIALAVVMVSTRKMRWSGDAA